VGQVGYLPGAISRLAEPALELGELVAEALGQPIAETRVVLLDGRELGEPALDVDRQDRVEVGAEMSRPRRSRASRVGSRPMGVSTALPGR